jgi:hypothetical protein
LAPAVPSWREPFILSRLPASGPYVSLAVLLLARLISGLTESLAMTGALAGAIGLVGTQNTGKVMVWVGIGMYAAIAFGSPVGVRLMAAPGAAGGFAAIAAGIVACSMLATLIAALTRNVARHEGERLPFASVIGRVAPSGAGLALATIAFGAIGTFAALDFQSKGWSGAGFALTGFGGAYIFTRVMFGGWPDRFGGARVAAWSLIIECAGQIMLWAGAGAGDSVRRRHPHRCRLFSGLPFVRHRSGQARAAGEPRRGTRGLCRLLRHRLRLGRTGHRHHRRRPGLFVGVRRRRCRRHPRAAGIAARAAHVGGAERARLTIREAHVKKYRVA